jgi:DeoR family transcriptional regulator of aga operon/DeoR family fructose operon transcriptional repressor
VIALERQHRIERLVHEMGRAKVADLSARFRVSEVTIRKDLDALDGRARIIRIRGGALSADTDQPEPAFDVRERQQRTEKRAIGLVAAAFVADGQRIALDASTTALHVARGLKRGSWSHLTVVTNSLRIATELAGCPGIELAIPGGWVRSEAFSVIGDVDGRERRPADVDTAFVGVAGFIVRDGLFEATSGEARVKQAMVGAARQVVAILDHSKWGRPGIAPFCATADVDLFLTDAGAPPRMVRELAAAGRRIGLVHPAGDSPAPGPTVSMVAPRRLVRARSVAPRTGVPGVGGLTPTDRDRDRVPRARQPEVKRPEDWIETRAAL